MSLIGIPSDKWCCSSFPNDTIAKYSVLADSKQLFASEYLRYLPTEEELRAELERDRAAFNQLPDKD